MFKKSMSAKFPERKFLHELIPSVVEGSHGKLTECKRALPILFLFFICLLPSLTANALTIPREFAQSQETYQGSKNKTVVLIQEVHVDYGAQKAIAEILRRLAEEDSLRLILVEGGWGNVSLSYLRTYADLEGRKRVAEHYFEEGKISAEEYLDIISDLPLRLWGIEDPKLYEENMKAFFKIQENQKKILGEIAPLKQALNRLQEKIFSPELQELQKQKEAFEEQTLSFTDYLRYLSKHIDTKPLLERYPRLHKMIVLTENDADLDLSRIEWEKQDLIRALSRRITKPELEFLDVLRPRKTPEEESYFLQNLLTAARKFPDLKVQNLEKYSKTMLEMAAADSGEIFSEIESAETEMASGMVQTADAKELLNMGRTFQTLKKLFELKLGPQDFEKVKTGISFDPVQWKAFIKGRDGALETIPDMDLLAQGIPEAAAFYQAAFAREKFLAENAIKKIEESGEPLAAVITGGFHSENLKAVFKKQGYSVLVVTPRFTTADGDAQQEKYFKILKYKWSSNPSGDYSRNSVPNAVANPSQGGMTHHAAQ